MNKSREEGLALYILEHIIKPPNQNNMIIAQEQTDPLNSLENPKTDDNLVGK